MKGLVRRRLRKRLSSFSWRSSLVWRVHFVEDSPLVGLVVFCYWFLEGFFKFGVFEIL